MLNIYVLNTYSKNIIFKSHLNNIIITLKTKYIKALLSKNSQSISDCIQNIQGVCPHLYLLDSNKALRVYIKKPIYVRKCIICDYHIIRNKIDRHNTTETNWQHYLRNENIQHDLILRADINRKPNIMNIFTINLNSYYNSPANRYSYIRFSIIHKINAIQLLILSYCDDKTSLFLNKSWGQFLNRSKEVLTKNRVNKRKIGDISFDNEIFNYKMNLLKQEKRCDHSFKSYKTQFNIKYCSKCKYIKHPESDIHCGQYGQYGQYGQSRQIKQLKT